MRTKDPRHTRILVLGSSGFLGSNLRAFFSDSAGFFFVHSSKPIFLTDKDFVVSEYSRASLRPLMEQLKVNVILNCVGFTDVDACERKDSLNTKLNYELPILLDELCRMFDVKLVHISTDHFHSMHAIPRVEGELMLAINEYGRLKLKAEEAILRNHSSLVIRTNFFGFNPSQRVKLLDWAKSNLEKGRRVSGFDDVFFTPISVSNLASALNSLIEEDERGLFHVVGSQSISKYEFLKLVAKALGCNQDFVVKDSITNLSHLVKRPNYLSLSNSKLKNHLPSFQDCSISQMITLELSRYVSR
jgi:dTDP-4-dehydrorhamnose reductase